MPGPDQKKNPKPVQFKYRFVFGDETEKSFVLTLDPLTLGLLKERPTTLPDWTLLELHKCSNCPLSPEIERCPIAVNLVDIAEQFGTQKSYEEVTVYVETAARTYSRVTTLQKGLSSMLGIVMTTSGCPVMDHLRPNVRFHLPFASGIETFVRQISMHLIANFFAARRGQPHESTLDALLQLYREITKINKGMSSRLLAATQSDANVNALVILHTYGDGLQYYVMSSLEELEMDYRAYFQDAPQADGESPEPPNGPSGRE